MTLLALALLLGAAPMSDDTVRVETRHFVNSAGARDYRLVRPAQLSPGAPLLVVLHGCLQGADDIARGSQFDAKAAHDRGWIVVYPQQEVSHHPNRCWNWYDPRQHRRGEGEPAIVVGMIEEVLHEQQADPRRVYLAGVSAGGAFALNLIALYPEIFAAVGVHSSLPAFVATDVGGALASMKGPEPYDATAGAAPVLAAMGKAGRAIPLMVMQGSADASVARQSAEHIAAQFSAVYLRLGVALSRTTDSVVIGGREMITTHHRTHGNDDDLIRVVEVAQLGHAWSGGNPSGSFADPAGPDASSNFLDFFATRVRPR